MDLNFDLGDLCVYDSPIFGKHYGFEIFNISEYLRILATQVINNSSIDIISITDLIKQIKEFMQLSESHTILVEKWFNRYNPIFNIFFN